MKFVLRNTYLKEVEIEADSYGQALALCTNQQKTVPEGMHLHTTNLVAASDPSQQGRYEVVVKREMIARYQVEALNLVDASQSALFLDPDKLTWVPMRKNSERDVQVLTIMDPSFKSYYSDEIREIVVDFIDMPVTEGEYAITPLAGENS